MFFRSSIYFFNINFLLFFTGHINAQLPVVDFDLSMYCISFPMVRGSGLFKTIYMQNNWQQKQQINTKNLIPKIIHFIWLGSALPSKYLPFIASWEQYHPDWEIKVWDDQAVSKLNLKNKYLYDQASNYGYKSDLARYEILYEFGGIYVDIDFECLQPFDFLHDIYNFYAGLFPNQGIVANGLFACEPKHAIMKLCVDNLTNLPQKINGKESDFSIQQTSGPGHFTKCILNYLKQNPDDQKIIILPASYFFVLPTRQSSSFWPGQPMHSKTYKYRLPESIAMHYWGCSWV